MYKIVFIIHLSFFLILNVIYLDAKIDVGSAFTLVLLSIFESIFLHFILSSVCSIIIPSQKVIASPRRKKWKT